MGINSQERTISISGSAAYAACPLKNTLQNIEKSTPTAAQSKGTDAHAIIEKIIKHEPYTDMLTEKLKHLFLTPATFVGCSFYKKEMPFDENLTEVENMVKFQNDYVNAYRNSISSAIIVDSTKKDDTWSDEVSIAEVLSDKVFGQKLLQVETRMEYKTDYRDWHIIISGKPDAISQGCNLIVDWKTTDKTPSANAYNAAGYISQQTFYRYLWCKVHGAPLTGGHCVLAYLVDTKVPKFCPICFEISEDMLRAEEKIIYRQLDCLIDYAEKGVLPTPNWTMYCPCFYKEICQKEFPLLPEFISFPLLYCSLNLG